MKRNYPKPLLFLIFGLLLFPFLLSAQNEKVTLSGYVSAGNTGEALFYAQVYIKGSTIGTTTNEYGFYSLPIPKSEVVTVVYSFLGYDTKEEALNTDANLVKNVALLSEKGVELEAIEINSTALNSQQEDVQSTQMSKITIQVEQVKTLPSLGGEVDLIKIAQLLPGVTRGGEGTTGMFVRGGDPDQNLILLDEAVVYNVGHLFGFFSIFNSDAIKDMTLIKGGFPAQYGGRLSSVLDIRQKEGSKTGYHGEGGIGLLSSRFTFEGPIIKDKMSFLVAGRRTYIDQVIKLVGLIIKNPNYQLPYYFYDLNLKLNWAVNDKNRIFFSSYYGYDILAFKTEVQQEPDSTGSTEPLNGTLGFGFKLGNFTTTLRWNHVYTPKLFSNLSLIHTSFNYDIKGGLANNTLLIKSSIRDIGAKMDFAQYQTDKTIFRFGTHHILHMFRPNIINTQGIVEDFLESSKGNLQNTFEMSVYGNAEFEPIKRWKLNGGLRLSGTIVKNGFYSGIEPRFSTAYSFNDNMSVKASYARMYQYMHLVSSSTVALPTDLWYPASARVKPQNSDQLAAGYNIYFPKPDFTIVIEGYYKWMRNLIEYKEGSNLILNDNFEDLLVQGKGRSYGLEFLLQKMTGRINGWVGYTLAFARRNFTALNQGRPYWAKYDRRHVLTVVGNVELARRLTFSVVWEYSSGARFTPVIGQYFFPNQSLTGFEVIPLFGERNGVRMAATHRLDVNFVFRSNRLKAFKWEIHVGGYNVYNRATPYQIRVTYDPQRGYVYQQPGLFGFIPSVAWNFKF